MASRLYILSDGCFPTEDLYFRGIVSTRLKRVGICRERYINCKQSHPDYLRAKLTADDIIVFFRTLPPIWALAIPEFQRLASQIIYVLDDDMKVASDTHELPRIYRERISHFATHYHQILLDHSDLLIVSSKHLVTQYAEYSPQLLFPALLINQEKSSDANAKKKWICYHATRSHEKDLDFIAPALRTVLINPDIGFESLVGDSTPADLRSRPNVITRSPKSWRWFRLFQRACIRHIGLAPLLDNPYNRGKSHIKFLDIAAVGAVGIFSNRPPYSDVVIHGENGFLANDDPNEWLYYLEYLVSRPQKMQEMASNARKTAYKIGHPRYTYRFWRHILGKN